MIKPPIAFLGLGIMGTGMARRLLSAGFPLAVFNRKPEKAVSLAADGAEITNSPREAVAKADLVISMLADDNASRALWLGENGALVGAKRGATLIECSTLSVGWVKELAEAATKHGCELVDAPVTGSKTHAAAGELNFLAGGSAGAVEKARPALAVMGKTVTHLGPTGSGALVKLINNFLCGVQAASLAEALALIEKSGLNREKTVEVLLGGAPGSPLNKLMAARMTARDYTPNFKLRLMAKDLAYAVEEGHRHSLDLATAACALKCFESAKAAGHGDQDFASIIEMLRAGQKG